MRYYDVAIGSGANAKRYTSHPDGIGAPPDPGALNVEIDVVQAGDHIADNRGLVRIWGISLADIQQSRNLNQQPIALRAGMGKGLPLANPSQAGLLVSGTVWQAFPNWVGTDMTLDLVLVAGSGGVPPGAPGFATPSRNIVFNWAPNTPMSDAIATALSVAFPGYKQNINIDSGLTRPNQEAAAYANMAQFNRYINDLSRTIKNSEGYLGVQIYLRDDTFYVFDGSAPSARGTKEISFFDLVGQPTWAQLATVQFSCVMRSDIIVSDQVKLPPTPIIQTPQSYANLRQGSIFQGTFTVNQVRHVGNFRSPNGMAWITTIWAIADAEVPAPQQQPLPSGPPARSTLTAPTGEVNVQPPPAGG